MEHKDIQTIRRQAIKLHEYDLPVGAIARELDRSAATIHNWIRVWREEGMDALLALKRSGRRPKLTEEQREELEQALLTFSREDFPGRPRIQTIQDHIKERYDQVVSPVWVGKFLGSIGTSIREIRDKREQETSRLVRQEIDGDAQDNSIESVQD